MLKHKITYIKPGKDITNLSTVVQSLKKKFCTRYVQGITYKVYVQGKKFKFFGKNCKWDSKIRNNYNVKFAYKLNEVLHQNKF